MVRNGKGKTNPSSELLYSNKNKPKLVLRSMPTLSLQLNPPAPHMFLP